MLLNKSARSIVLAVLLFGLAIGLAGGYLLGHTSNGPETEQVLVAQAIDGDTIELADGRLVRYLGIDTPEQGEFYGPEASAKNRELVQSKLVELQPGKRDLDEFGRLLRYVYVNGTFVNAELVAQGLARAYIFDPDERYSQVLVQLEQYAKISKRGLWVEAKGAIPYDEAQELPAISWDEAKDHIGERITV